MFITYLVFGFGFGNLAMLGWLAAAAVPLVVHLWNRRRYRPTPWAAMHFLRSAMKANARRLQLRQWLLLAVRTLMILLIVFAMAEPYGRGVMGDSAPAPVHRVFVLDGSFSMGYRAGVETTFDRAKETAAKWIAGGGPGDSYSLIRMSDRPAVIARGLGRNAPSLRQALGAMMPTQGSADLSATLSLAAEIAAADDADRAVRRAEVYFLTDLQGHPWREVERSGEVMEGEVSTAEKLSELAGMAQVMALDLARSPCGNIAITKLSLVDRWVAVDREAVFEVELEQFGGDSITAVPVSFDIDGVVVEERTVDLTPGGSASLVFRHRFDRAGFRAVRVHAGEDPLPIDNDRWLAVRVTEGLRVLLVAGKPGAARYLSGALEPDPTQRSPILPTVISPNELAEADLADFACVMFSNVAHFSATEAIRIRRYAKEGGGVVFFLGDEVRPDSYNELLAGENGVLPARLGSAKENPQGGIDPQGYRHPIVEPFRSAEGAGLLTTPIAHYFALETDGTSGSGEVVVSLSSGDPLIVANRIGQGRVVVVGTDVSLTPSAAAGGEAWSAWPAWPSFLPIVREIVDFVVGDQFSEPAIQVGAPLQGFAKRGTDGVRITRPDQVEVTLKAAPQSSGGAWSYDATDVAGIYKAEESSGTSVTTMFAVNVDPRESDLAQADRAAFPEALKVIEAGEIQSSDSAARLTSPATWSSQLLGVALVLMLLDTLLGWYFGRSNG